MTDSRPEFQDLRAIVPSAVSGLRLDQAISRIFPLSRRRGRRAIDEGGVYLNGKRCRTASRVVKEGDALRVVLLEKERLVPFSAEQLLWRDESLYLIHKRAGQYAQEALHRSRGTLPDELARHLGLPPRLKRLLRPVHRLDRGTSGLMLFCSDARRLQHLQQHWRNATCKEYLAVVEPAPDWETREIRLPIGKRRDADGRYHPAENGRPCFTEARVLERRGGRALLLLFAHTGRSHQLRVHLSSLGCPILGDARYRGKPYPRLMLHAYRLTITPPAMPEAHDWRCRPEEDWQW